MEGEEDVFWADKVVERIVERNKNKYVVNDSKTPSGRIHIGHIRGWVIHQIIYEALNDAGLKAEFRLGQDDFDELDKIPSYFQGKISKEWLGKPLCNVPAPFGEYKNYGDAMFGEVKEHFEELNLTPLRYKTSELYRQGEFDAGLKEMLDNAKKINEINARISGAQKPGEYLPFKPVCENCGKIMTTFAFDWNGKTVKYRCRKSLAEGGGESEGLKKADAVAGCGHEGEISPFGGTGKAIFKLEWPIRWKLFGVDCEFAGKDLYTKNGAREVADVLSDEVFQYPHPYGEGYEFFNLGTQKMSSSKGVGVAAADVLSSIEPKLLRFLMTKTRPKTHISFDPSSNAIPFLYEEYDKMERTYFEREEERDGKRKAHVKRVYELSQTRAIPKQLPVQVPFSFAAALVQVAKGRELEVLKRTGHIPRNASSEDTTVARSRLDYAKKWLKGYAPEEYRMKILEEMPNVQVDPRISALFAEVAEKLKKRVDGEKIQLYIYNAAREKNIPVQQVFATAYKLIIGKERGPRLGPFLVSLERDFIIPRLRLES
ncbi:lysine--tRNA ligase [Candidatus Micrarchaeota archaeon]|nr:lysine--tRNA ligase [Candidatus Micrarchaeota archaeon]